MFEVLVDRDTPLARTTVAATNDSIDPTFLQTRERMIPIQDLPLAQYYLDIFVLPHNLISGTMFVVSALDHDSVTQTVRLYKLQKVIRQFQKYSAGRDPLIAARL